MARTATLTTQDGYFVYIATPVGCDSYGMPIVATDLKKCLLYHRRKRCFSWRHGEVKIGARNIESPRLDALSFSSAHDTFVTSIRACHPKTHGGASNLIATSSHHWGE